LKHDRELGLVLQEVLATNDKNNNRGTYRGNLPQSEVKAEEAGQVRGVTSV